MRSADKSTGERGLARKQLPNLDRDNKKDSLARITPHKLDKGSCQQSITGISSLNWRRLSENGIWPENNCRIWTGTTRKTVWTENEDENWTNTEKKTAWPEMHCRIRTKLSESKTWPGNENGNWTGS